MKTVYISLLLLASCTLIQQPRYSVRPFTYYKHDSVKTRDYLLIIKEGRTESLVEPEMLMPEEKIIYDSLINEQH